jgi:hypothetical protein
MNRDSTDFTNTYLVTNVDFTGIECSNVSFKTSNTREAIFSKGVTPE